AGVVAARIAVVAVGVRAARRGGQGRGGGGGRLDASRVTELVRQRARRGRRAVDAGTRECDGIEALADDRRWRAHVGPGASGGPHRATEAPARQLGPLHRGADGRNDARQGLEPEWTAAAPALRPDGG